MLFARRSALTIGVIGFVFFALAFFASIARPGFVEQIARNVIRYEVEKKVHEKVEAINTHFLSKKAQVLARPTPMTSPRSNVYSLSSFRPASLI